jgi:fatty-acyl-CoA synthase
MAQAGRMMERPLLISSLIEHGEKQHGQQEVVSRETDGSTVRRSFAEVAQNAKRLANALHALGLRPGDAVGTIAWNNVRHVESYYGVSGSGLIIHTCNPRLHPEQLAYIINHADDQVVLFDTTFAPLVQAIAPHCPQVKAWVSLTTAEQKPHIAGVDVLAYDDLLAAQPAEYEWPDLDERSGAALCYTSGTTGNPKGVLYSHRSLVLDSTTACMPDIVALGSRETIMPVTPMFHINAWCIPYAAMLSGCRMVLPGPKLDGASLYELMESERVTISAGVPTIWMGLIQHLEANNLKFSTMKRTAVGGSAMPKALIAKFHDVYGVEVRHGWGMTETAAVATMTNLSAQDMDKPADERHAITARQGKAVSGVEIKVVDEHGHTLPRDGESQGELMVRGHWVVERYHKAEASALVDGWFPTGDIATIAPDGVMTIRDRTKDVIKSGGEWISSIDLENAVIAHPAVAMAAVIGVPHPKWDERPLLLVVTKPEQALDKAAILAFLEPRIAKWWMPDEVIFVDSLPVGGTGKVQKNELRKTYGGTFAQ